MRRKKRIIGFGFNKISPYISFGIFVVLYIVGVLVGTLTVGRSRPFNELIRNYIGNYVEVRSSGNFFEILADAVLSVFPYFVFVFLLGTAVIGFVAAPIMLILKGISFGAIAGYLYFTYKLEGIIFSLLIVLPVSMVAAFGLVVLTKEAFGFSYRLGGVCLSAGKPVNISSNFKSYYLQSLLTLIPAAIAVILDVGMSVLFIGFFSF